MKDYKELINDLRELIEAPNDNVFIFNAKALMANVADALEDDGWRTDMENIPCGKALLVTIVSPEGRRMTDTAVRRSEDGAWWIYERGGFLRTGAVVAWRDVPEPYKGG